MPRVYKQETIAYSANEMYSLVNDIYAYPEFLPWCTATDILEQKENCLTASISIAVGKLKQTFTTENTVQPNSMINIRLIEGPFKELRGYWKFCDIPNDCCTISLNMQFEFKNRIIKRVFNGIFYKIIDSLMNAFVERAREIYGER